MELYTIVGVNQIGRYFTPYYDGINPVKPKENRALIEEKAIELKQQFPYNEYFVMKVISKVEPYTPPIPTYIVKPVD